MKRSLMLMLVLGTLPLSLQGCIAAVGAGAAVVADEVMEQRNGDDGLF